MIDNIVAMDKSGCSQTAGTQILDETVQRN